MKNLTFSLTLLLALPFQAGAQETEGSTVAPPVSKPGSPAAKPKADAVAPKSREKTVAETLSKHQKGSAVLSIDQDELSADVQDLIDEQTSEEVIQMLESVEEIMGEAIDRLEKKDTGGDTIAAETEIIEKIFDAAKKRQQKSQEGGEPSPQNDAMMEMMEQMMGNKPGDKPGKGPGKGEGEGQEGGEGQKGDSDAANEQSSGKNDGSKEARTVPKAAGKAGSGLPPEFQKALDAYNK